MDTCFELNEERFMTLLGKLIGEAKFVQNQPPRSVDPEWWSYSTVWSDAQVCDHRLGRVVGSSAVVVLCDALLASSLSTLICRLASLSGALGCLSSVLRRNLCHRVFSSGACLSTDGQKEVLLTCTSRSQG
jgi:hypothetical protein